METVLAALSSARLQDLIGRLLVRQRQPRRAATGARRSRYPALRHLVERDHPSAETTDLAWLQRIELRRSRVAIEMFENRGLRHNIGRTDALFIDSRCGLIRSLEIGCIATLDPAATVGAILAEASDAHAAGIILGTNDVRGRIAQSSHCTTLVANLYHKGEATEIYLLDHFVLTASGWARMFPFNAKAPG